MPSLGLKLRLNKITASILKVYTTGLVLWQKMVALPYTGAERMPDSSGTGNVGEIYSGYCFDFATNDSIDVGDTEVNVKTIAFYLYADTTTQDIMELQASGAVMLDVTSGTLTATGFTSPTIYVNGVAGTSIAATTWYHVVITTATAIDANAVKFGVANGVYFNGKLTDIRFYGAELTANQVAEIYANPEKQIPAGLGNSDLVAWWPFTDVAGTTAINAVAGGLGGAINGATMEKAIPGKVPQWGLKGNSQPMVFDNSNDYVECGTALGSLDITGDDLTIYTFLNKSNDEHDNVVNKLTFGAVEGYGLQLQTNERVLFITLGATNGELLSSTGAAKINKNNQIVCTYDGANKRIYVNNSLINTQACTGNIASRNAALRISNTSNVFTGIIYEVGIWDKALSAAQIESIHNGTDFTTIESGNLQGAWRNTGNTNADWVDLSGNGNNGTVNGSPVTTLLPEGLVAGKDLVGMDLKYPNNGAFMVPGSGYISAADDASLDLSTSFTLDLWFYVHNESAIGFLIIKGQSYRLYLNGSEKRIYLLLYSSATVTVLQTAINVFNFLQWNHLSVAYDNTDVKFYLNSALLNTVAYTSTIDNVSDAVFTSNTGNIIDNGLIDSVKIYNVALTADQVLQNYKAEKAAHS